MPRVCCLPRVGLSGGGAVKRRSKGDAGADGGFDGSGIAFQGDPHSYERRRTYGPEPRRRVGMHGAALVRIPNPFAKSEATPPRPFVDLRNRLRVAEPAGAPDLFQRAADRARLLLIRHPGEGRDLSKPTISANFCSGRIPTCAGMTVRGRDDDQKTIVILGHVPGIHCSVVFAAKWIRGMKPRMTFERMAALVI